MPRRGKKRCVLSYWRNWRIRLSSDASYRILISFLLFTFHLFAWNPDKHWGFGRWRVLTHSSPLFTRRKSSDGCCRNGKIGYGEERVKSGEEWAILFTCYLFDYQKIMAHRWRVKSKTIFSSSTRIWYMFCEDLASFFLSFIILSKSIYLYITK